LFFAPEISIVKYFSYLREIDGSLYHREIDEKEKAKKKYKAAKKKGQSAGHVTQK
jgi:hypothetical protein